MDDLTNCLPFYIGCETNKGQLVGIKNNSLFIRPSEEDIVEDYDMESVGVSLFLCLRKLSALTPEQSTELINKGFNIGRPKGYSFSPEAFLFLIALHVDLFGLIQSGLAEEITLP